MFGPKFSGLVPITRPKSPTGVFEIPIGLCHEIEGLVSIFWWGQHDDQRKIHWVKWDELTKVKVDRGMGFRDLAMFNDSPLAKQAWHLLQNTTSLFYRVFKAKFFPDYTIMEAKDLRVSSYTWRSILKGRDVIQKGSRWWVRDGRKIKIWQHYLLPI